LPYRLRGSGLLGLLLPLFRFKGPGVPGFNVPFRRGLEENSLTPSLQLVGIREQITVQNKGKDTIPARWFRLTRDSWLNSRTEYLCAIISHTRAACGRSLFKNYFLNFCINIISYFFLKVKKNFKL
jgi:hypothetical protein